MFMSGVVKLTSGDPTWRHLTALTFHYQTQPLPTPVAWYAMQLPAWFQQASCALMFAIELAAPFCIAGPRALRHAGALALAFLQVMIAVTGNYAFFNLRLDSACASPAWTTTGGARGAGGSARPPATRPRPGPAARRAGPPRCGGSARPTWV